MVGHRKIEPPARSARVRGTVPAAWFLVLTVLACVGAAGWLGVMLLGPTSASADDAQASGSPSTSAPASPTPSATTPSPDPTPSATPTPTPTPEPVPVKRSETVAVFNNTGIGNLARSFSAKVAGAGWTVSGLGNWRGEIVANTVYYPDGLQDQAELLAKDVGIARVLPSIVPMRMDRLTIILSGPQQ